MSDTAAAVAKQALAELIARLEAATEGSRELDWAIREAIATIRIPFNPDPRCWVGVAADGMIYRAAERGGSTNDRYLPFYTTSLDAALMLLPEGLRWYLKANPRTERPSDAYEAEIFVERGWSGPYVPCHYATTPALALCGAALKARAV